MAPNLLHRSRTEPAERVQQTRATKQKHGSIGYWLSKLGPGLITGASDDDPSGVGTYSIAGAQFGYGLLWTALISFPLMAGIQLICARLGMVSGRGLAGILRIHYGRAILWPACALLVIANVVNIGADLGGMAAASGMVTGVKPYYFTPAYALLMGGLMGWFSYRRIARVLKWLTAVLFAYVVAAFAIRPAWGGILRATFWPSISLSSPYLATLVAVLGTTISPYLFFWQAAQEVEEDRDRGKTTVAQRKGATKEEERSARFDVISGTFFSNLIMFFIIVATAATLHAHGKTHIATTQEAAEALRPLAGNAAYLLFTLGIIGTGLLSVPVLAGSTAYAVAEGLGWRNSLKYPPRGARGFYGVLAAALLVGVALNFAGASVVSMLFWAAVVNGVLAPPLVVVAVIASRNRRVMGDHVSSPVLAALGWLAAGLMGGAAVAMFVTM